MCFMELMLKETWSITCSTLYRALFRVTPLAAHCTHSWPWPASTWCTAVRFRSSVLYCITENNLRSVKMHREIQREFQNKKPLLPNAPGVTWRPVKNGKTPGGHDLLKLSCLWWTWNKSDFCMLIKYWSNFWESNVKFKSINQALWVWMNSSVW